MPVASCCSISWHCYTALNLPFASFAVEARVCGLLRTLSSGLCCRRSHLRTTQELCLHSGLPSPLHQSRALSMACSPQLGTSAGKTFGCTFHTDAVEQHRLSSIYYAFSPSFCSLVTELQVSKMIAITENSVVCAALDFSIMSRHYDLG